LTFLAIDAKGGEGALECLDLGGAHGLLMEIIRFQLPLASHVLYICVFHELYLRLVFGFEPWFVMCDELC
jgi:hypothetical protein